MQPNQFRTSVLTIVLRQQHATATMGYAVLVHNLLWIGALVLWHETIDDRHRLGNCRSKA